MIDEGGNAALQAKWMVGKPDEWCNSMTVRQIQVSEARGTHFFFYLSAVTISSFNSSIVNGGVRI